MGNDGKIADRLAYDIQDLSVDSLLLNMGNFSVTTESESRAVMGKIDAVIDRVSGMRGAPGAMQNGFEHTINVTESAI